MKSYLFITIAFLNLLVGCSSDVPKNDDYIKLVPLKLDKPVKNKPILDEIGSQKVELEKLQTIHKYVIEDTQN